LRFSIGDSFLARSRQTGAARAGFQVADLPDNRKFNEMTKPRVTIEYCTLCNWMLRAAWLAQELLQTFGQDIGEVALIPATGGTFVVTVESSIIWDRKIDAGFPEAKALKQRLRDKIWPDRDLGHADVKPG
jgi:selenoprotein W-related protein